MYCRVVEQSNVPKAMDLLKQACELFELEDKEHYSGETFKIAINLFLRNEKYGRVTLVHHILTFSHRQIWRNNRPFEKSN